MSRPDFLCFLLFSAYFKEELLKTTKFADDEDAEKVIKSMFKEGLIYESKPGFFRRVGS